MASVVRQMARQFSALGVLPGDVLLVHSSLSALGFVSGGPAAVIDALTGVLGYEGTLLLPALSYASVGRKSPLFDVRHTPCCVGTIPEFFRSQSGVLRSVHPTHSVCALGKRAEEMTAGHELDTTPVGEHSPFRRLRDAGGKILMLGCGLRPNTSLHGVEELVEPPYLLGEAVDYRITLAAGNEIGMSVRRHQFDGWIQCYDRIEPLLSGAELRTGYVLSAYSHLMSAPAVWRVGLEALRKDAFVFVQRHGQEGA